MYLFWASRNTKILFFFLSNALFYSYPSHAQPSYSHKLFTNIDLQIDTNSYVASKNSILWKGNSYIQFQYSKEDEVCDVKLWPSPNKKIKKLVLQESGDYNLIDSIVNFNNQYFTFKVQFKHLTESDFLRFRINVTLDDSTVMEEINLFPTTTTTAQLNKKNDELSVGEEKVFELFSNHPENIIHSPDWVSTSDFDYRVVESNGQLSVHVVANSTGNKTLTINLKTFKPSFDNQKPNYDIPPIVYNFNVKSSGLQFLQTDKNDIVLDEDTKNEGIEVQIDNNRFLKLNNTYLIEAKEAIGSPLIAEIFTREKIAGNKVLCLLRVFNYHRKSEGYLYIKEGNAAQFITNFNIIPKVTIEHLKIMRNGKDWTEDATIFPNETFNLRIEGQSLDRAHFRFGELINLTGDSLIKNENFVEYKLKVPLNVSKKTIDIFNFSQSTGKTLTIKEYQRARPFDYINIAYGNRNEILSDIKSPELYDKLIKDVIISFNPDKIDSANSLFGKQYLTIDAKIIGKKGEIIDYTTWEDIVVCPGEKSPRYAFYDKTDSKNSDISLNSKLSNNTYDLSEWSKIKLTIKNKTDKYTHNVQSKSIEIILQKHANFDIDVSFPSGLLIKKFNQSGYGNFGGVSMAVIGQFSFYDKNRINHLRPYKIGAGFLALNAFDFNHDASDRDMGVVLLGTLNPINTERKLTFSIYLGAGYLLSQKTFFGLIGPGISVQF
jgi:hypothetical protein